jgi:predicted esterase
MLFRPLRLRQLMVPGGPTPIAWRLAALGMLAALGISAVEGGSAPADAAAPAAASASAAAANPAAGPQPPAAAPKPAPAAPKPPAAGQTQAPAASHPAGGPARNLVLTVAGGSGGGEYPAGSVVHIWADPPPAGSVFDRWTGNLEPLIDRYAAHTTLVMPEARMAVRAVFKRAPACAPASEALSGVEVTHCVPPGHSGVILLFHGNGGAGVNFFRNAEPLQFVADAAAGGFALLALDSHDRERKAWQIESQGENPDIHNVRAVLDALVQRRLIARGEPLYALGLAGGGNFAARLAQRLPCKAAAIFFAPGNLPPDYAVPTLWLMAQNEVNRQPRALAEYTRLAHRQIPAKFDVNDPSPVYPLRFRRIRGVDADQSQAIYHFLKEKGYLDAKDMLAQDPESSGWETALPERFAKYRGAIREQLDVCFGLPRFFSDFDNRILDFFNEHR